jgi:hypothetical protein
VVSLHTRRRTPAELAAEAAARASAHAEDWGTCAPPRRPRQGHTADCPDNGRPMPRSGRCRFCRAEALEAVGRRPLAGVVRALIDSHPDRPRHPAPEPDPAPEERACVRCYAPTVHPSGLCGRCQPGGTT